MSDTNRMDGKPELGCVTKLFEEASMNKCKSCAYFLHLRYVRIKGKRSLQVGQCRLTTCEVFGDDTCKSWKQAEKLRF